MSLRDRLNQENKKTQKIKEILEEPKYFVSDKEAQEFNSLGIIDPFLADDELNSIFVNGAKNIFIERNAKIHKSTTTYRDNVQLENMLKRYAREFDINADKKLFFEFNHQEGINISATLPPLSDVPVLYLKCYKDKHATSQTLLEEQSCSKEIAMFLEALSSLKLNALIIGEKNTLKTTLLSAIAKKTPINLKSVVLDNKNEFKIKNQNFLNYDFSKIQNDDEKKSLIESVISSKNDKIYVNETDEKSLYYLLSEIFEGKKGFFITQEAKNYDDAINKLTFNVLKNNPNLNKNLIKSLIYQNFDIIILVKKDEVNGRYIQSISELDGDFEENNFKINDIFNFSDTEKHTSSGIIPKIYEEIKLQSIPLNSSIFDKEYKHTYCQNTKKDAYEQFSKKNINLDILKKFKKDLKVDENQIEKPQEKEISLFEGSNEEVELPNEINEVVKEIVGEVEPKTEEPETTLEEVKEEEIKTEEESHPPLEE